MSALLSPSVISAIVTIVAGLFVTLIGIIYRRMRNRLDNHDDDISSTEERTATLFSWAFGNEADSSDLGVSADIDENFDAISEQLNALEEKHDRQHEEVTSKLDQLVSELHHDENVDIDREDIE